MKTETNGPKTALLAFAVRKGWLSLFQILWCLPTRRTTRLGSALALTALTRCFSSRVPNRSAESHGRGTGKMPIASASEAVESRSPTPPPRRFGGEEMERARAGAAGPPGLPLPKRRQPSGNRLSV
jgi:hypothetical protein